MHLRIRIILMMALAAMIPATAMASARKNDKGAISFHLEGQRGDNPKMIFDQAFHGKDLVFKRMPEIINKDIASFRAFPAENEAEGFGIVVYLKPDAARRIGMITNANRGKWLAANVNGRAVDAVIINDQVNDGILVIWKNLSPADIATLEKALPKPKAKAKPNADN